MLSGMKAQAWFDALPLWLLFLLTLALITSVIEIGFRVGRRERNRTGHGADTQVGLAVTSVLGLVAFIVGFALGLAETRYESRREAKFSEADAVSTAYARASFLPDSSGVAVRRLLRRAAALSLELGTASTTDSAVSVLEMLRDSLWQIASAEANARPEAETVGLFVASIGDVFDVFEREVFVARHGRIPPTIWVVFLAFTMLGAGLVGYASGLSDSRRPTSAMAALTLARRPSFTSSPIWIGRIAARYDSVAKRWSSCTVPSCQRNPDDATVWRAAMTVARPMATAARNPIAYPPCLRNEMSSTGAPSTTIMAARTPSEGEPGGEMTS